MNAVTTIHANKASSAYRKDFFVDDSINKVEFLEDRKLSKVKILRAFKYIDTNSSGGISWSEFREFISLLNVKIHNSVLSDIFTHVDRNCSGTIELHEFQHFLETPLRPKSRIRCDFSLNLTSPSLFLKFHVWHVKSRPLSFTLSPGRNDISAYFEQSSDPTMSRCLKQGARLFYINNALVKNAPYKDIEFTLCSIHCPFILVFQNYDTRHVRTPEELNVFKDMNFEGWPNLLSPAEKKLFWEPFETNLNFESATEASNNRVMQYDKHCKHCPPDEAWYLHIHRMMEDETYSAASYVLTIVVMLLIALSTFTYVFQTLPAWEDLGVWQSLEGGISIAFTVEFLLRISSCRSILTYMKDYMNVVDFCAVIPYWLELASSGLIQPELLRVVRVIRLLRLIRLVRSRSLQDIMTIYRLTCEQSIQWIIMFLCLGFIMSVVVASFFFILEVGDEEVFGSCNPLSDDDFCEDDSVDVLYDNLTVYLTSDQECESSCAEFSGSGCCSFNQLSGKCQFFNSAVYSNVTNSSLSDYSGLCVTEKLNIRLDGSESPFFNIPISLWFTDVTMTMVGYGVIFPVSYGGRLVAVFAAICGPIFLALPLIIVGSHFSMSIYSRKMAQITSHASKYATVDDILRMVNDVVGMQLFKPNDQLPFLEDEVNLSSKQKIENVLLFKNGWVYLPYSTEDIVGIARLTQYKLFVLFGIFGKKIKRIMSRKKKQITNLRGALNNFNQKRSVSRPRTIKIVNYPKGVDHNNNNDFPTPKRSPSAVNIMKGVSNDWPIVRSRGHTRRSSEVAGASPMESDPQSYVSPRKLVEYCSFSELKTVEPVDNSITRTENDSASMSMPIAGVKSYKPNHQEWV